VGDVLVTATQLYTFIANNWTQIAPWVYGIAAAIGTYTIAMKGIALATKGYAALMKAWKVATNAQAIAQAVLNGVMAANPIGLVVIAVAALVGIFVLLWNKCEGFRNFFINMWEGIKIVVSAFAGWLGATWEGIKSVTTAVWEGIKGFFIQFWPFLLGIFTGGIGTLVVFVVRNWDNIKNATVNAFTVVKTTVLNIWNGIVGGIKGCINSIISAINGMLRGIASGINGVTSTLNKVTGVFGIPAIPEMNAPQIPMLWKGGRALTSGAALVGERGPELLDLPKGARVTPLEKATSKVENRFEININGTNLTVDEILDVLVPKLKFAIANM